MKRLLLFLFIAIAVSCNTFKAAQAPVHNDIAETMSLNIINGVHTTYEDMKNNTDKSFVKWQPQYDIIITEFHDLLVIDSSRKNNVAILKLTNDWLNRFNTYINEHKSYQILNNGQILIYQDWMGNLGKKVYLTEKNYK